MRSFFEEYLVVGGVALGVVGCSSASPAPATSAPPPTSSAAPAAPRTNGSDNTEACKAAGGMCISPVAAVACRSEPAAACGTGLRCCVM